MLDVWLESTWKTDQLWIHYLTLCHTKVLLVRSVHMAAILLISILSQETRLLFIWMIRNPYTRYISIMVLTSNNNWPEYYFFSLLSLFLKYKENISVKIWSSLSTRTSARYCWRANWYHTASILRITCCLLPIFKYKKNLVSIIYTLNCVKLFFRIPYLKGRRYHPQDQPW